MIELSQWRASIGLWNCCCSGMKLRNKSSFLSTTKPDADKGLQQSFPTHFLIVICLLLNLIFTIGSAAHCYCSKVQCNKLTSMKLITTITFGLCFGLQIFFCSVLLLLSGDVELNPGPVIDEQPDIAVLLDLLEPLENWQSFGLQLPGITQQIIDMISQSERSPRQQMEDLFEKWFEQNPKASWKDVLDALRRKKETKLIEDIEDCLKNITCDPVEPKDNHASDNPKEILRSYSYKVTAAITNNLDRISDALYANGLISLDIKIDMLSTSGISDYKKASRLVTTLLGQMEASLNPQRDLINICRILINQSHSKLTDIATSMLDQLGQPYHAVISSNPPNDVQKYINCLKEKYQNQPIVASDWPPRVGKDFFGKSALVRENNFISQAKHEDYSQCMLRGDVDKIPCIFGYEEVAIETVLNPDILSLRVAIDGPPGIGKTTLCRKLLNMWSIGSHELQHYDLVLYCPFRHKQVAEATKLAHLFTYESPEVSKVVDWITEREGKGLLIIFDGWDELSTQLQESSLAISIICMNKLVYSSVIVTSRTYATASLLQLDCLIQNVHIIGFFSHAIDEVIKGTLHDQELAEKLIKDLELRNDVLSLCYVPLVCFIVILVYRKSGGHLPTTISELYQNFILQTIRRHVKKTSNNLKPQSLESLDNLPSNLHASLQQMSEFAYLSLKKAANKMTFTSSQLENSLHIATKENYLGLITTISDFDEEWYQFIHLSIQEFLAAWWIAKSEKTEKIFKNCFKDDHFRLCLRFVAGLTKLKHESYQQYFSSTEFDLQCRKRPFFEIGPSHFWLTSGISTSDLDRHHISLYHFPYSSMLRIKFCFLLHLLYESQNRELCHILANFIKNYCICLGNIFPIIGWQPPFDVLCFTYFIHNSNTSWSYLHFHENDIALDMIDKEIKISTCTAQCVKVVMDCLLRSELLMMQKFLLLSQQFNVQEIYFCANFSDFKVDLDLLKKFFKLPQLNKLQIKIRFYPNLNKKVKKLLSILLVCKSFLSWKRV